MGAIFRKMATKPLPHGAEIVSIAGKPHARWKSARGKTCCAAMVDSRDDRITVTTKTYYAKYRDGSGIVRTAPTGCKDSTAARKVLSNLEKRAENVKSGIATTSEDASITFQKTAIGQHFETYQGHQAAKGNDAVRLKNDKARFDRLCSECGWRQLSDLTGDSLATWLANRTKDGKPMSAGNRNEFRQVMVGFANWCVRTNRLLANPFANVSRADAKADQRRKRRALTEAELLRLLDVARRRPLDEALMIRRGKDKGKLAASVRDDVRQQLVRLGRERALIYKTLVLTGLRKSELASLTVGQLHLEVAYPFADLAPEDEKNREGSRIPLRRDLADELSAWISDKATIGAGSIAGAERRDGIMSNKLLFNVPAGLLRILDRDLAAAGIPKRDERGRTVDVHAMRHSFGTLLSKGGVAPRTAQAAMRHSSIDLTMNTYTDPKLLDIHGALDALPSLRLDSQEARLQEANCTAQGDRQFAPAFAPNSHNTLQTVSKADNWVDWSYVASPGLGSELKCVADKEKQPADNHCQRVAWSGPEGSRTLDLCIAKTRDAGRAT